MKKIYGDLLRRIRLNRKRLGDDIYRDTTLLSYDGSWPGDFQGRAILALTSLYHALDGYKDEQDDVLNQLNDIFLHIDPYLNKHYYFGNVYDGETIDEQQISGNSWYLRGLINYYKLTNNEKYLKQIEVITNEYLLKLGNHYQEYPLDARRENGEVGGHISEGVFSNWKLSSDIGCAFIMLDGLTAVYEVIKLDNLRVIIEQIIDMFLKIDFVNLQCQTHATLSCARGIYRFYQNTKDSKYLEHAMRIFDTYISNGMTYDYSNINWFNRPETWTEPCCVIDSMILAKELFIETKNEKYLKLFNKIFNNSVRTFQRDNGGAGCSTCAYDQNYELKNHLYEAFFCCTMRLGEGLYEIEDFSVIKENNAILIPTNVEVQYESDDIIYINNEIYKYNKIVINAKKLSKIDKIYIYIPDGVKLTKYHKSNNLLEVNIKENQLLEIPLEFEIQQINDLYYYGDVLLTRKQEENGYYFLIDNNKYSLIYDNSNFKESELNKRVQYVR